MHPVWIGAGIAFSIFTLIKRINKHKQPAKTRENDILDDLN